jgi:pimeloyl-ACP methyl ester carboxylesterase
MATYVLVHDARHTGKDLEKTASSIREAGHQVHTPTIAGNKPGDPKTVGLDDAIGSIADYLAEKNLKDVILLGHGYGGMIITVVADRLRERIRRGDAMPAQHVVCHVMNAGHVSLLFRDGLTVRHFLDRLDAVGDERLGITSSLSWIDQTLFRRNGPFRGLTWAIGVGFSVGFAMPPGRPLSAH